MSDHQVGLLLATHWRQVQDAQWPWRHFLPQEMACRGSGVVLIERRFMDRLERLRDAVGMPLPVSSGYRSPAYNARVSSSGVDGPHTTGRAVDLRVFGARAHAVLAHALGLGFTGLGIQQTGPTGGRFIHLDDLPEAPGRPRPWVWGYPSREDIA